MAIISVTPEQLKSQAKVYLTAKDEIESAVQKVNSMNNTIAEEWKGAAFEAYLAQNRTERHGSHSYAPADFGLSEDQLHRDFAFYSEVYL